MPEHADLLKTNHDMNGTVLHFRLVKKSAGNSPDGVYVPDPRNSGYRQASE